MRDLGVRRYPLDLKNYSGISFVILSTYLLSFPHENGREERQVGSDIDRDEGLETGHWGLRIGDWGLAFGFLR